MQSSSVLSLSPSFNTYSSSNLADIATRVVEEFRNELGSEFDDMYGLQEEEEEEGKVNDGDQVQTQVIEEDEDEDEARENFEEDERDDFEFPSVCSDPMPAISADEIFYKGQIRPVFPIFGRDLLFPNVENGIGKADCCKPPTPASIRISLGKLMSEDRDPPSCSSSEADDLDGVPAETYCVWSPKTAAAAVESTGRCKKSNSTGSSKRWRFRDLIHRSNSDGEDTFVFLTSSNADAKKNDEKADGKGTTEKCSGEVKVAGKVKPKVASAGDCVPVTAACEAIQVRCKVEAAKDGDRRRSYLPYRQDSVGLFANVNGLSRNLHPF